MQFEYTSAMVTNSMSIKCSYDGATGRWCEASGNTSRVTGCIWEERLICIQRDIREFKKTTTATGTPLCQRFNEQNNDCAL